MSDDKKHDRGKPVKFIRMHGRVIPIYAKRATNFDNIATGIGTGGVAALSAGSFVKAKQVKVQRKAQKAFRISNKFAMRDMPRQPVGLGKKMKKITPDIFEMSKFGKQMKIFRTAQANAIKYSALGKRLATKATKIGKWVPRVGLVAGITAGLAGYATAIVTDGE